MNYRVYLDDKPDECDVIDAASPSSAAEEFVYGLNSDHGVECGKHRVVVRWPHGAERVYDVACAIRHVHTAKFVECRDGDPQ